MSRFVKAEQGLNHTVIYTDDSGKHFRFSGGTWAWRNHNPGNLYPGNVSKRHNQIGFVIVRTTKFAIFPDRESGHLALIDSIRTNYNNSSIETMMYKFAPPPSNNTTAYINSLRKKTGVNDDRKIKDFTPKEFENLWRGIEQIESYQAGTITEMYQIIGVRKD